MKIKRLFENESEGLNIKEYLDDILLSFSDNRIDYNIQRFYINKLGKLIKLRTSFVKEAVLIEIEFRKNGDPIFDNDLNHSQYSTNIDIMADIILELKTLKKRIIKHGYSFNYEISKEGINVILIKEGPDMGEYEMGDDYESLLTYLKNTTGYTPDNLALNWGDNEITFTTPEYIWRNNGRKKDKVKLHDIARFFRGANIDIKKYDIKTDKFIYKGGISRFKNDTDGIQWTLKLKK